MEKMYHSIQDWNRFADTVYDIVKDYLIYGNGIDENDGIYVDEEDETSLVTREEAPDELDFHSIIILLDLSGSVPEINYDAICDLTDKYIFVR